ncbi:DNA primase family protein [Ferribacterium limneticum]|uniref:DNA primase family protein n=1 Tax=Ferribacterium limneticum TaxID=76259 RepID=UPI001CFAA009|nr:phage/plasmid primase, P4 family [Ferribacterium limneticum]UCV17221.1 hypothetical protein KI610_10200 [Ferribacterium limneticum]
MRTPSEVKKAAPAGTGTTSDTAHVADSTVRSSAEITVLETVGDPLTTFFRGGERHTNNVFNGASRVRKCLVENLSDVAELLDELYREPLSCIVQGAYVGDGKAKHTANGLIEASKANFKDCLARLLIIEVGWDTEGIDPVTAPEEAILQFIDRVLPEPFQDASFVWRMCRRSEHTGKRALKAHLVFWLERPMKLSELDKWRESVGLVIKPASCKPGYPISTAGALLEDGTVEPSQNQYGYFRAGSESVALLLVERPAKTTEGIDRLTVLETTGPHLTKTYKSDGTTEAYGDAASFKVKTVEVADLPALATLLGKLHKNKKRCLIAGAPKDEMQPGNVQGSVTRTNANFDDQPLHSFVIDIDGYRPGFADPILETELAVLDFLAEKLPPCFRTASFYWHLSSSAGMPGKEGILKCHLWMWSKTAYTTAQMYEWAKAYTPAIDKAVYRRVQIRYTADPIFEEGRTDPVPVRSGWHQGETDYVDLVIAQDTLAQAREQGSGEGGSDMKLVDPSEKPGLVGLYNKVFTAEEVLLNHLEGEFEAVSERRYTWHNGGGTPEGVWVHDDGMHVGSSHNTWPIDGIANLWDLVRVFKFGHLDASDDAFEQEDIDSLPINAKPSNLAMLEWAGKLPELLEAAREDSLREHEERAAVVASLIQAIAGAETPLKLMAEVVPAIKAAMVENGFQPHEQAELENSIAKRFTALSPSKAKLPAKALREMLAPEEDETARVFDLEMGLVKQVLDDWFASGKHLTFIGDSWWLYRGGVWKQTDSSLVENRVQRSIQRILAGASKEVRGLTKLLRESERGDYLNALTTAVCGNLRRFCAKEDKASDPLNLKGSFPESVINCRNGELWFDEEGNVEFVDHDPAHKLTFQLSTSYEPTADCPKFKAALGLVFKECKSPAEVSRHFLELMGTVIQPRRIEAMWMLLKGRGENGKTFLVDIIEAVMGGGACLKGSIADAAAGKDNHFTSSLVGKLAFIDDDVKQGVLLPDDWLKKLSEEKVLTANPKNSSTFQFTSRATMIMLANHWPRTADTSHGMTRRAHVIEFKHQLTEGEKDPNLKQYIMRNELPGVLNLLVEAWQRVLQRGRYQRPDEVTRAADTWMRSANTTGNFFRQMLVSDPAAPAIKLTIIEQFYRSWMAEHEPRASALGKQALISALQNAGFNLFTQHNQLVVRGVSINPLAGDDAPADYVADEVAERKAEREAMDLFNRTFGRADTVEEDFKD